MNHFNIGDTVWHAKAMNKEKWITCPDCLGTRTLKVILGDGTEHVIDCAGCSRGYEGPTGSIRSYNYESVIEPKTITGVQIKSDEVEYYSECWILKACDVFATETEARERSAILMTEYEEAERKRLASKEKPSRDWAWHVHYHRSCIRKAEAEYAYHTAKLAVSLTHKKEGAA
jgi:hypothetical protein